MKKVGFEPTWGKLTDLQSVAFDHSAISPYIYTLVLVLIKYNTSVNTLLYIYVP